MTTKTEIPPETIEKAQKALSDLPAKKSGVEAALEKLKPTIEGLLKKGYKRPEILELLNKQGIPAKAYHVNTLLKKRRAPKAG